MKKIGFLSILIFTFSNFVYSQLDTEFWFVASEVSASHGDLPIYMRISTMEKEANINLSMPANASFPEITQTISPNSTVSIRLDSWKSILETIPPDVVHQNGLFLESDVPVTAYYEIASEVNPEIYPLKGKNALGQEFYIPSQNDFKNQTGYESFEVLATENNTTVTIIPTDTVYGHEPYEPIVVTLNKGETFSVRAKNQDAATTLAGSVILSNKPIVVTHSDDSIRTGGWDLIGDQLVPVDLIGKKYIAIRGYADGDDEIVYVLAVEDNTSVYLNGSTTPAAILDKGEQFKYPLYTNVVYVETDKPAYMVHLTGHKGEAGSALLPPITCTGSHQVGFVRTSHYSFALLVLVPAGYEDDFKMNGDASFFKYTSFYKVPGTDGYWKYTRMEVDTVKLGVGTNLLQNDSSIFHLGILNKVRASSEYGYFSGYSNLNLGNDVLIASGDSIELDAGAGNDSYLWNTGAETQKIMVKDTGNYWVDVTFGNGCLISDTINISYYNPPDLGKDTSICVGNTIILDAGSEYNEFLWSDGSTKQKLAITMPGTYWVEVKGKGFKDTDTINVALRPFNAPEITTTSFSDAMCKDFGEIRLEGTAETGDLLYSLDGITYQDSGVFLNVQPGEHQVFIKDENNCLEDTVITITKPDSITVSYVNTQEVTICSYNTNGSVSVAAYGGTPPLKYSIDDGTTYQGSGFFSGLTTGKYTVTITDANQCVGKSIDVTVAGPEAIKIDSLVMQHIACHGEKNGRIYVKAVGGRPFLRYRLNTGSILLNGDFSNLQADSYHLSITDGNNCVFDTTIQIIEPDTFVLQTITPTHLNCYGDKSGVLDFSLTGGVTPYEYSVDNGSFFSTGTVASNLDAKNYTIVLKDAYSCEINTNFTLTQPDELLFDKLNKKDITCFGDNDGAIQLSAAGGVPDYTYGIGGAESSLQSYFDLMPGIYTVSITDSRNCMIKNNIEIKEPDTVQVFYQKISHVKCFGENTGEIDIEVSGGIKPIRYSINGIDYQATGLFDNLNNGDYSIHFYDQNNCGNTIAIKIEQPQELTIDKIEHIDIPTCFGDPIGALSFSASGGVEPISYGISGHGYQTSGTFNNITGGNYTIAVKDANNCVTKTSQQVTQPEKIEITDTYANNISCFGYDDGEIYVNATGGTGGLTYKYHTINSDTGYFPNLTNGFYTVTISDKNLCTDTISYTINEPTKLTIYSNSVQDLTCYGQNKGIIIVNAQGGTMPLKYQLNEETTIFQNRFNDLAAGSYKVRVIDENACIDSIQLIVSQPDEITLTTQNSFDLSCFDDSTGYIEVKANGGVGKLLYSIDSKTYIANGAFEKLNAGNYSIVVKDENNCTLNTLFTLTQPEKLTVQETIKNLKCNSENTGKINFVVTGGTIPYLYSIDSGNIYQQNSAYEYLASANYDIFVKDAHNCLVSKIISITQPEKLKLNNFKAQNLTCFNDNSGLISFEAQGGTGNLSYTLNNVPYETSTFKNLSKGTYNLKVVDANNCQILKNMTLTEPEELKMATLYNTNVDCYGNKNATITSQAQGGTGVLSYSIDNQNYQKTGVFLNLNGGIYTVYVKDENNCFLASSPVDIFEPLELTAEINAQNISCLQTNDGKINYEITGGTENYQVEWFAQNDSQTSNLDSLNEDIYTLKITDDNGCVFEHEIELIYGGCDSYIEVPNVFSPNNDGVNDEFYMIDYQDIKDFKATIFNRWGKIIYEWNDINESWNGANKLTDNEATDGIYFYVIEATGLDNKKIIEKGSVYLRR